MRTNLAQLKEKVVRAAHASKEGHVPSALSILDILWVLYNHVLKYNPKDGRDNSRDRFILSKGHASLGLYAVLAEKGLINGEDLSKFCEFDSALGGHPDRNKIPWVEASTGSLGHGFPIATGIALALKIQKNPARVFTIIGDGEINEGSIWEGAMLAAHHKLNNLCAVVDHNHSTDRALDVGNISDKFTAFGWRTVTVDGHDHDALLAALNSLGNKSDKPLVIVANTVKGKGIKSMESNPAWHHKSPSQEELDGIIKEIYLS